MAGDHGEDALEIESFSKQHLDYLRKYTAGVKEVEVDGSGRFLIPKPLLEFAKIDKEVVLAPALNFIEVWDRECYEAEIASIDEEAFMALTEKNYGSRCRRIVITYRYSFRTVSRGYR